MSEQELADQDVLTHLTHAFTLFMEGDPVGARLAAQLATDAIPVSGPAQAALGHRLLSIDDAHGAETALRKARDLGTCDVETLVRLARSIAAQDRHQEAIRQYETVLRLDPANTEALIYLSEAAVADGRTREALSLLRRATQLSRDNAPLWLMLAGVAQVAGDSALSERARRAAYTLDPGNPMACLAMAEAALAHGRHRTGQQVLVRASRLDPTDPALLSRCLRVAHLVPGQTQERLARLHRSWHARYGSPVPPRPAVRTRGREPLVIGLVLPDPPDPLLDWRLRPLLRHRDPDRLKIVVMGGTGTATRAWEDLRGLADTWVDCAGLATGAMSHRIRTHRVDILVDLGGHGGAVPMTLYARHRPAPIQVSWTRYPGTTGLQAFDALLTDKQHVPDEDEVHYTETVVRLESGALACEPPSALPPPGPAPRTTTRVITLGSLAPPLLVGEPCLDLWAAVLRALPGSHLAMIDPAWRTPAARNGLRDAMRSRGLDPERLRDGTPEDPSAPWTALPALDAVLDTVPMSHDTGALVALSVGVPMVTLPGKSPGSRFAAAHMLRAGQQQGIAESEKDFVIRAQRALKQPRTPVRWDATAWVEGFTQALEHLAEDAAPRDASSAPEATGAGAFTWDEEDTVVGDTIAT